MTQWEPPRNQQPVATALFAWERPVRWSRLVPHAVLIGLDTAAVVWTSWYTSGVTSLSQRIAWWVFVLGLMRLVHLFVRWLRSGVARREPLAPPLEHAVMAVACVLGAVSAATLLGSPTGRQLVAAAANSAPVLRDIPSRDPQTPVRTAVPPGGPQARPDARSTAVDTPVIVNVAANDDGELVADTVLVVDAPNALAVADDDGIVTVTPRQGFVGEIPMVYEICTAKWQCTRGVARITVG